MEQTIYLGIGAGPAGSNFRVAAEHVIRSSGHRPVSPLDLGDLANYDQAQARSMILGAAASFVPVAFPFAEDDSTGAFARVLEAEYEAVLTIREEQATSDIVSAGARDDRVPSIMVLTPCTEAGVRPEEDASQLRIRGPVFQQVAGLIQRARQSHGQRNAYTTPDHLALAVNTMLIRAVPTNSVIEVMLSSTTADLADDYRLIDWVFDRLGCRRDTRYTKIRFTEDTTTESAKKASADYVKRCAYFVGLVKQLAGTAMAGQEDVEPLARVTYTQFEFDLARRLHRPRGYLIAADNAFISIDAVTGTSELDQQVTLLKEQAIGDLHARHEFFRSPDEIAYGLLRLLDWLGSPGRDRTALPPPEKGLVYAAHEYTLVERSEAPIREGFIKQLSDWWTDRAGATILSVKALGGMGKSAATWAWFSALNGSEDEEEELVDAPSHALWWSFYAPDSDFETFLINATRFLYPRLEDRIKRQRPSEDADLNERTDFLIHLLKRAPGRKLVVFDGLERALQFYREPGFDARLTEGPAIDEFFRRSCDELADELGDAKTAERALLALADGSSDKDRLMQLAGTDDSPFAEFIRRLAELKGVRLLVTTRFTPTVMADLNAADEGLCALREMAGWTGEEIRLFWEQQGLVWETDPTPDDCGGDELPSILEDKLEGYALPIALLARMVGARPEHQGSFAAWKSSLEPLARIDRLSDYSLDECVLWVVHQVLDEVETNSLDFQVLSFVLQQANATDYPALREQFVQDCDEGLISDKRLDGAIERLRRRKLLGRDDGGYRYELHPLVRRAVLSFDPDERPSVRAYLEDCLNWSNSKEPKDHGLVPLDVAERLWQRVETLVRSHAPRSAGKLFRVLDSWIRFRTEGDVVERRWEYLEKIESELERARKLMQASTYQ